MASLLSARDVAAVRKAIGQVCDTFFTYPVTLVRPVHYFDEHGDPRDPVTEEPEDWDEQEDGEFVPEPEAQEWSLLCYRQHASEAAKDDRLLDPNGVGLDVEWKFTFDAQALETAGLYDPAAQRHLLEETDVLRCSAGDLELVKAPETAHFVAGDLIVYVYGRRKAMPRPAGEA